MSVALVEIRKKNYNFGTRVTSSRLLSDISGPKRISGPNRICGPDRKELFPGSNKDNGINAEIQTHVNKVSKSVKKETIFFIIETIYLNDHFLAAYHEIILVVNMLPLLPQISTWEHWIYWKAQYLISFLRKPLVRIS
jgi:hypothetical protein